MKTYYILLFVLLSFAAFSENDSISFLYKENRTLREKINELEKDNAVLRENTENTDTRFADNQWWFLIFTAVLAGAFTVNWVSTNNAARKQAREELQSMKDEIDQISQECLNALNDINQKLIEADQIVDNLKKKNKP